jgi:zinc transport system ATP-binding protein
VIDTGSTAPALSADGITFSYGRTPILDGITFEVGAGEFVALAGPNGSGKSTLLRIVLGLLAPSEGRVTLLGHSLADLRERWRIGYVPQRPVGSEALPATVAEVVAAGRMVRRGWWRRLGAADRAAVDGALEAVDLGDLRGARLGELSGGQQQRAFIAKALATEPDLLVLDEPIAGVDAASQRRFRDALVRARQRGAAVLLVSHEFGAVADDLDRLIVLSGGRVTFDGPPSALTERGVSLGVHDHDLPVWLEGLEGTEGVAE